MIQKIIYISLFLLMNLGLFAQNRTWKMGFELGTTSSKMSGEEEKDGAGNTLEKITSSPGFHLLIYSRYHVTDDFGVQIGIQYAQRGLRSDYDGESYFIFDPLQLSPGYGIGIREETSKIFNGYLDLPILAFNRFGKHFEVAAGGYVGLLISSKNDGELRFEGEGAATGSEIDKFIVGLDYNYLNDKAGTGDDFLRTERVDGTDYFFPTTLGANYFFSKTPSDALFKRLDAGLMAHVAYYFNSRLNVKVKGMYGLVDVTNNDRDISIRKLNDDKSFIYRDDVDRNLSLQISLGFAF